MAKTEYIEKNREWLRQKQQEPGVIMLDKGEIILKENTGELLERAVHISGLAENVDAVTAGLQTFHEEKMGRSKGVTVLLREGEKIPESTGVTMQPMNLQQVFVALCGKSES